MRLWQFDVRKAGKRWRTRWRMPTYYVLAEDNRDAGYNVCAGAGGNSVGSAERIAVDALALVAQGLDVVLLVG
jgi:hypothetical protein